MQFDIMHFEALGSESQHLEEATKEAQAKGLLPKDLKYEITPDDLQTCQTSSLPRPIPYYRLNT